MSDSKKSGSKSSAKRATAKTATATAAPAKTSSSLERRVEKLEAAFLAHFNVDLAAHDAEAQAARERGAEVEAGKDAPQA